MTGGTIETAQAPTGRRRVRALLLSDRIETSNLERDGVVSTVPLTYRFGKDGLVTVFRYGVAVLIGLAPAEEDKALDSLSGRLIRPVKPPEEDIAHIVVVPEKDDQILPGGPITLKAVTPEHLVVIADALSKSGCWHGTSARFPPSSSWSSRSRGSWPRRAAPRAADAPISSTSAMPSWCSTASRVVSRSRTSRTCCGDRPDLERLYARLEDEYELKERAEALTRKLSPSPRPPRRCADRHHRHPALVPAGDHHRGLDRGRARDRGLSILRRRPGWCAYG